MPLINSNYCSQIGLVQISIIITGLYLLFANGSAAEEGVSRMIIWLAWLETLNLSILLFQDKSKQSFYFLWLSFSAVSLNPSILKLIF